ncbi:MAG: MlaD family protein [Burkholderiales bacterium]
MAEPSDSPPAPIRNLEFKAALLLIAAAILIGGSILYLLYARGVFTETQKLILTTDNSEGVVTGMDLTFSGFPIGRVGKIELAPDATVRIVVDVERDSARWLRISSVFTLERALVGGTKIRAFSGILDDPPLAADSVRMLLRGDALAELPRVVIAVRELVENLKDATGPNSPLGATLANVRTLTDKFNEPGGAVGALLGGEDKAGQVAELLDQTSRLLATVDALMAKASTQVFGKSGLAKEARDTAQQLERTLATAQASLKRVDLVLKEAQGIAANTREATTDLGALRGEVESSLRKIEQLVTDVNRRLPFKSDPKNIRLP